MKLPVGESSSTRLLPESATQTLLLASTVMPWGPLNCPLPLPFEPTLCRKLPLGPNSSRQLLFWSATQTSPVEFTASRRMPLNCPSPPLKLPIVFTNVYVGVAPDSKSAAAKNAAAHAASCANKGLLRTILDLPVHRLFCPSAARQAPSRKRRGVAFGAVAARREKSTG